MSRKPIVSRQTRIRHRTNFFIKDYSIVDDFCYFSTKVKIGKGTHIASNVTVAGGGKRTFEIGDYSSISSGVRIWCASNNYSEDLVVVHQNEFGEFGDEMIEGDVIFKNYTGIGSNSVVMPGTIVSEGTTIGALSFVPAYSKLEKWSVYAGIPVRKVGIRNKDRVLSQVNLIRKNIRDVI